MSTDHAKKCAQEAQLSYHRCDVCMLQVRTEGDVQQLNSQSLHNLSATDNTLSEASLHTPCTRRAHGFPYRNLGSIRRVHNVVGPGAQPMHPRVHGQVIIAVLISRQGVH